MNKTEALKACLDGAKVRALCWESGKYVKWDTLYVGFVNETGKGMSNLSTWGGDNMYEIYTPPKPKYRELNQEELDKLADDVADFIRRQGRE